MTEPSAPPSRGESPGALLRRAREQQGMDLDTLAATVKVRPEKLAALESDHYEQLPDMAFTRALAKTLCRTLKIDATPVLAGMPTRLDADRLEQVATGLNTPFRDHGARRETRERGSPLKRPVMWAVLLLLIGAAAIVLVPASWFKFGRGAASPDAADAAASAPLSAAPSSGPSGVVETVLPPTGQPAGTDTPASAPAPVPASPPGTKTIEVPNATTGPTSAASAPTVLAAASAAGLLVLRASGSSWVEVRDAGNKVLLSRSLQAGEAVNLDGPLPMRATIGNASATAVSFRGEDQDLRARTRDNVARVEFK